MSPNTSAQRIVTVFAKRPISGQVKTRLVPPLDLDTAAGLADAMLADTVEKLRASEAFAIGLCIAPAGEEIWFRRRFPDCPVTAQVGAGLGERMAHFFEHELALPATFGTRHIIVGSDGPHLPTARIVGAFDALDAGAELVLGPDAGGGYDLVGLTRPVPELFTQVPMSTGGMCAATVELARSLGLRVHLCDEGYDLDHAADLARLARELFDEHKIALDSPDYPHHTARLLAGLRDKL